MNVISGAVTSKFYSAVNCNCKHFSRGFRFWKQLYSVPKLKVRMLSSAAVAPKKSSSDQPLPPPCPSGEPKTYSSKVTNIVDQIVSLSMLEACDLNELLKKRLNISDIPMANLAMMAPGAVAAAPAPEEDVGPAVQEKMSFDVKLVKFEDAKKIALIKEIKNLMPNLNLVQAKKFVESLPQTLKTNISKVEGEKFVEHMKALGGICELE